MLRKGNFYVDSPDESKKCSICSKEVMDFVITTDDLIICIDCSTTYYQKRKMARLVLKLKEAKNEGERKKCQKSIIETFGFKTEERRDAPLKEHYRKELIKRYGFDLT